jgi:hypothetical protein
MFVLSLIGLVGCEPQRQVKPLPAPLTLEQTLGHYNTNIQNISPFKAFIKRWEVCILDENGKQQNHKESLGKVFYCPPLNEGDLAMLYLQADWAFGEAFVIGSNQTEYWFYTKNPKQDFGQWGKYEHLGKPCANHIPFNPQRLLEYIGLRPLSATSDEQVELVYKNPIDSPISTISYIRKSEGGSYYLQSEILFDRYTNQASEILEYDENGQVVLHSKLNEYASLENASVPTDILITYPLDESYIHLKLHRFKLDRGDRTKLFTRRERISGIDPEDYQQIDKQCENE